jgi:RNA polymerase sigma-70 factor (ECF subfamily)
MSMRTHGEATTELHAYHPIDRPRMDRDHEIVEALRLQEPTAAERLVAAYGDRAYRLAIRITRAPQDAEEVVQDALLTVVRKIDSFRGEAAFGSWVYRIVANAAYQKIRGRRRRQGEVSLDAVVGVFDERARDAGSPRDGSLTLDGPARQTEVRTALTEAIDELPTHYRAVFVLRDVEGLSHGEISEILSLSAANVKTRIHRARLLLRNQLRDSVATYRTRKLRSRSLVTPSMPATCTA